MSAPTSLARFRPLSLVAGYFLGESLLLRVVLWKLFGPQGGVGLGELPAILVSGLGNDLVPLVVLALPLSLLLVLLPPRLVGSRWFRGAAFAGLTGLLFALLVLGQVEFCFFQQFNARFNLVAIEFLKDPRGLLVGLWSSYPVVQLMLADLLLALLLARWSWPLLRPALTAPPGIRWRWVWGGGHLLLVLPALLIATDSFDVSSNRMANELAHNGISSLFRALQASQCAEPRASKATCSPKVPGPEGAAGSGGEPVRRSAAGRALSAAAGSALVRIRRHFVATSAGEGSVS